MAGRRGVPTANSTMRSRTKTGPKLGRAVMALALVTACPSAWARATCTASVDDFDFGSIALASASVLAGTATITCRLEPGIFSATAVHYCLDIGSGSGGASPTLSPRWLRNNANEPLDVDLISDDTQLPIGSGSTPSTIPIAGTIPAAGSSTRTRTHRIQVQIPAQPDLAIGLYQSSFAGSHTELNYRYADGLFTTSPPASCRTGGGGGESGIRAPFNISARIDPECYITTVDSLDFGNVSGLPGPAVTATAAVTMRCRRGTPWQLSLGNGLHAQGQARRMSNGHGAHAQYELFRDVAMSQRFGQIASGDHQPGTGTGTGQIIMIHGQMPASQSLTPGSYSDTVVVTVTY